jgi:hypothetical protein
VHPLFIFEKLFDIDFLFLNEPPADDNFATIDGNARDAIDGDEFFVIERGVSDDDFFARLSGSFLG